MMTQIMIATTAATTPPMVRRMIARKFFFLTGLMDGLIDCWTGWSGLGVMVDTGLGLGAVMGVELKLGLGFGELSMMFSSCFDWCYLGH